MVESALGRRHLPMHDPVLNVDAASVPRAAKNGPLLSRVLYSAASADAFRSWSMPPRRRPFVTSDPRFAAARVAARTQAPKRSGSREGDVPRSAQDTQLLSEQQFSGPR